jgi:hypothetical protein
MMSIFITGTIISGLGSAARSLESGLKQRLVAAYHPIEQIHCGTINVQLDQPLRIHNEDFRTPEIEWFPSWQPQGQRETFGFLHVGFECPLGETVYENAWIFRPSGNARAMFADLFFVEIVAEPIQQAAVGTRCQIRIEQKYNLYDVIVV